MSSDNFKAEALRLGEHLSRVHGYRLKHSSLLEAIAASRGARNWQTLSGSAASGPMGAETKTSAAPALSEVLTLERLLNLPKSADTSLRFGTSDANTAVEVTAAGAYALVGARDWAGNILEMLAAQRIAQGGTCVFIEGRPDSHFRDRLFRVAQQSGRENQFYSVNFQNPSQSLSYSPIYDGSPEQIAARILRVMPQWESSVGADFYLRRMEHALWTLLSAFEAAGIAASLDGLTHLLQDARAFGGLTNLSCTGGPKTALNALLAQYQVNDKQGVRISSRELRDAFGALVGRLAILTQGRFGQVLNHSAPDVSFQEVFASGGIVHITLPPREAESPTGYIARMMLDDLEAALFTRGNSPSAPAIGLDIFMEDPGLLPLEGCLIDTVAFSQSRLFVQCPEHTLEAAVSPTSRIPELAFSGVLYSADTLSAHEIIKDSAQPPLTSPECLLARRRGVERVAPFQLEVGLAGKFTRHHPSRKARRPRTSLSELLAKVGVNNASSSGEVFV